MISQTTLSTSTSVTATTTIDNKTTIDNNNDSTNINNNINNNNNNEKIMYLLRGISGSGKSTLAQNILNENLNNENLNNEDYILSTDDYFINKETNKYIFNPTKLGDAHQWNQNRCKKAMERNQQIIIIDNTNTQKWEAKPYVQMAKQFNYKIIIKEPETEWKFNAEELAKRNKHGVPLESIKRMISRWEKDFNVEAILQSKPPSFNKKK
ncbi:hypothetical protein ABK040_003956 [Willaertia magna]